VAKQLTEPFALHRFPELMSRVIHAGLQRIAGQYEGHAERIWEGTPGSAVIVRRFLEFDGVGPKIATMAANILVKGFRVPVSDKYSIDVSVDVHVRRVTRRLGLVGPGSSDEEIIYRAREINPRFPGVIDFGLWELGRTCCRPQNPACSQCGFRALCRSETSE
jgi:endonuclease III